MKTALFLVAGLVAGLVIAFWLPPSREPSVEAFAAQVDQGATLEALVASNVRASSIRENATNRRDADPAFVERGRRAAALTPERLVIDLIVAGFAPDRAEWINRRMLELRMHAMQARDKARREGRPQPPDLEAATLRTELGDADYERVLIARNLPTRINVLRVLAGSAAERAGLRPGDEIFAYDGTRVFDIKQLNALARGGRRGDSVVVDVRRNGQNFGFGLAKGPIGISSGGDVPGAAAAVER